MNKWRMLKNNIEIWYQSALLKLFVDIVTYLFLTALLLFFICFIVKYQLISRYILNTNSDSN